MRERERRREAVRLEAREGQVLAAPVDRRRPRGRCPDAPTSKRAQLANHAAAAAAESRIDVIASMPVPARSSASPIDSAASRPLSRNHADVGRARDAHDQVRRRHRQSVRRAQARGVGQPCGAHALVRPDVGASRRVRPRIRRSAFFAATRTERTLAPMTQAPALPRGSSCRSSRGCPDRLGRPGRGRGPRRRAREAFDQAEAKVFALDLAIRCMDLTTLEGSDTPGKVAALCSKAVRPDPTDRTSRRVAAVCVYPNLVPVAVERARAAAA